MSHEKDSAWLDGYNRGLKARDSDNTEVYTKALSMWGAEAQTRMVYEEMAELQKELCKHSRGADNTAQIAEEIADVRIMLDQMVLLHGCADLTAEMQEKKIRRLKERLGL